MKQSRGQTKVSPRIILTRPADQVDAFAAALVAEHGAPLPILIAPLMAIQPVSPETAIQTPEHLIFTSANAVNQVDRLALSRSAKAWCVGDRTAAAAKAAGFTVHNAQGNAEALVDQIIAAAPQGSFLHLRGEYVSGTIVETLNAAGIPAQAVIVYAQENVPAPKDLLDALGGTAPLVIPLFSPRSARLLGGYTPFSAPTYLIAMSGAVADVVQDTRATEITIAKFPDQKHMIAATIRAYRRLAAKNTP